mgnify:FL=1
MYDGHFMGGGIVWIFWIIILLVLFWLFNFSYRKTGKNKSASEILEERYAQGEITEEEFEEKKRVLNE